VRAGLASPLDDGDAERFRRLIPHATTAMIPHASHLVARDAPCALADLILKHLNDPAVQHRRRAADRRSTIAD
jgi:pimeloyl-ACP methyl ester carboxylesterase